MAERSGQIADYVEYVVQQLVENDESVNITESVEGEDLYVDIDVNKGDRGRVIGKNGRLIRSLRVVVRAAAGRDGSTAHVELIEEDDDHNADGGDDAAPAEAADQA
jgi:predicted RNA-binding protein YlqC (UPF0109 family)